MKVLVGFKGTRYANRARFANRALVLAFVFSIIFFSCSNFSGDASSALPFNQTGGTESGAENSSAKKIVTLKGTVGLSGALPKNVAAALFSQDDNPADISKTARPVVDVNGTAYDYFARAEVKDKSGAVIATATGTFGALGSAAERSFEIKLEVGKVWTIICGVKDCSSGAEVYSDSIQKEITADEPILTRSFYPAPTFKGSGTFALDVSFADPIKGVAAECSSPDWNCVIAAGATAGEKVLKSGTSESDSIKSGNYDVALKFLDESGAAIYECLQTICVFDNMKTDTWISDGSACISSGGALHVDGETAKKFLSSAIYVGKPAELSSRNDVTVDDDNGGGPYEPLESLTEAARRISLYGRGGAYKICVSGTVTGPQEIPAALTATQAKSVTILGLTGLDGNKKPRDSLDAQKGGTTLSVNSTVPITIKNLLITGGSFSGIRTKTEANCVLTLADGALVAGNSVNGAGGGIFHGGGKLFMIGWACVGDPNAASCAQSDEASSNHGTHGGGIYVRTGSKFFMGYSDDDTLCECTGGIFYNYSSNTAPTSASQDDAGGGGIDISNGSVKIASGTIKYNGAARAGGGVATSIGTIEISGGTICDNKAAQFGGGVYIGKYDAYNPKLKISGGTVIKANQAPKGGAVYFDPAGSSALFSLSGAASLPYVDAKNDIYLADGKTITVAGPLTSQETVAAITPANWKRGTKVLEAGADVTDLTTSAAKFALTAPAEDEWQNVVSEDKLEAAINAPYWIGTGGHDTNGDGTFAKPFASVERACQEMDDAQVEFIINVNGTVAGAQKIPSSLSNVAGDSADYHAKALTISGKNGPASDILSGGFTQSHKGTTLTVESPAPITIKNVTITGGYAQTNGGGIAIKGTTTVTPSVTLSDGAMVVGNSAATSGGGVYVEKAYFYMNGTAKVGGTDSGQGNSAQNGGGVYVNAGFLRLGKSSESAEAELSGGIYGNTATKEGGGISVNGSGWDVVNIEMLSGNISSNKVDGGTSGGGGVYLYCTVFDLKGGSIESNSIENPGASTCGGAININTVATLQIGGSVSIPYGGSQYKNDIAQKSSNTIELSSALDSGFAATVVANAFALDSEVLSGTEELLASECFKFNVFQPEEASQFLFVGMQGKLRTLISFPNGTQDGTETNEDDGLSYDVYKYSYINYDNLSMSVVNPYAALGYTIQAKVDGEFPEDLTKLEDGFHTVYAKIEKAGKPTIEDTVRVCVKIKTVRLTLYKGEIDHGYDKYKGRVAINGGEVRSWGSYTGWDDPTFNTYNWSFTVDAKDYKFLCQTTGSYGRDGSSGNDPLRDAYRQYTLADIKNNDGQGKAYISIYSGTYPDPSGHSDIYLTLQLWFNLTD